MSTTAEQPSPTRAALPPLWRASLTRGACELKKILRERDAVVFTLVFPIVMFVLFSAIFAGVMSQGPISAAQYYLPAMLTFGLMSTSFQNLGIGIATERDEGTLKRLRGTPMPKAAYFAGKMILVLVTCLTEAVILILVGALVFGVDLPGEPARWWTFGWVVALGVGASTLLGIAVSSLPRSGRSASAVITLPYMLLMFVSGVFIPAQILPEWVRQLGLLFPPAWLSQGLQAAFLPDAFLAAQPGGPWDPVRAALVLAAWCAGGLVLCLLTFRWKSRRDG